MFQESNSRAAADHDSISLSFPSKQGYQYLMSKLIYLIKRIKIWLEVLHAWYKVVDSFLANAIVNLMLHAYISIPTIWKRNRIPLEH